MIRPGVGTCNRPAATTARGPVGAVATYVLAGGRRRVLGSDAGPSHQASGPCPKPTPESGGSTVRRFRCAGTRPDETCDDGDPVVGRSRGGERTLDDSGHAAPGRVAGSQWGDRAFVILEE